jgi:starvation-inducible DNA-binding protein
MTNTAIRNALSDPAREGMGEVTAALRPLLADAFCLYMKTKSLHWHIRGRHFRDYHLLLDEQAGEILTMTDEIAERARKIGGTTLRSIGDIARHQRLKDNDSDGIAAGRMLAELRDDNVQLAGFLKAAHEVCVGRGDVATSSVIEVWIDQAERRAWFLTEITSEDGVPE